MNYDFSIFCDCGAPSLYGKLSAKVKKKGSTPGSSFAERKYDDYSYAETPEYDKYRDSYIEFLHANKSKIDTYSNLDVINNPKKTFENQRIMEAAGLHPIPVFHLGNDEKWLTKYVDNYDYVAIGGIFPNPLKILNPMLDKLFKKFFLDKDGFAKIKTHGFGCTAMELMIKFPWYSVDSATARKLAMYGWMSNIEYNKKRGMHLTNYRVSSRDIPLGDGSGRKIKMEGGLLDGEEIDQVGRWTPEKILEFERRANEYGMTMDLLSTSILHRMIWNYVIYRVVLNEHVPAKWPWNYYTREIQKGADKEFIMYFAGLLSKKEETAFWEAVANTPNMHLGKGRLQSYFYKGHLEHVINLKYNDK